MMFLKGLQWFEWLLIGVVVTMLGAGYLLWNKYDDRSQQVGSLVTENNALVETVEIQNQSATISDQITATFVQQKEDEKVELQQSREGVIDDYVDMVSDKGPDPTPVLEKPKTKVTVPSKTVQVWTTKPEPVVDPAVARINLLANRMHTHYCRASPDRGVGCTLGTNH